MKHNMLLITMLASGFLTCAPALAQNGKQKNPHLPEPVTDADFREHSAEKVELGRKLMFDKILSGNSNTSCATCHHSLTDTGDGLSLPVGEGGRGLGVTRDTGSGDDAIHERVPRNAPPVFNLGAHEFTVLFHDGRVEVDPAYPSGCKTPAGYDLPDTLENILACQAMFPVTSPAEMAGQEADGNDIADAAAIGNLAGPGGVWDLLAQRLQAIPEYVALFKAAFPDDALDNGHFNITYAHAANAIAAFEGTNWRADNSPFDRYLHGDKKAMSKNALQGMRLFYRGKHKGKGNRHSCAHCHSGKFQTDHSFHAIAMPQIGPGKGDGTTVMGHDDYGREQVTLDPADRYTFRTPTLRNVALTAPYGHSGCYNSLRAVVEHHIDAVNSLRSYDGDQAVLPSRQDLDEIDFIVMNDADSVEAIAAAAYDFPSMYYSDQDVDRIMDFLHALTDPASIDLRNDTPASVPSGLTLAE